MSEEKNSLAKAVQGMINFVPVGRELSFSVAADWLLDQGFVFLQKTKPDLATWLHDMIVAHPSAAWFPLWVIGEAIGKLSGKPNDHVLHARIADALVAARKVMTVRGEPGPAAKQIEGQDTEKKGLTIPELQQKLASLPVNESGPIILRIHGMPEEKRQRVLALIGDYSPEQLENLMAMPDEVLDALLAFDAPEQKPEGPREDKFLDALRRTGQRLKAQADAASDTPKEGS